MLHRMHARPGQFNSIQVSLHAVHDLRVAGCCKNCFHVMQRIKAVCCRRVPEVGACRGSCTARIHPGLRVVS